MTAVSVAMPVYNAADSIRESLESALNQTYRDLEVVVVDNRSTDDTAAIVREYGDERIRFHQNEENLGYIGNANRSIELSRGEFVKFLHADDVLLPGCVERMVELMRKDEAIGMVFSRRRIEISDESDPDYRNFRAVFGKAYERFGELHEVNDGTALLRTWLRAGLMENWVGEPSSVMMRRSALERTGGFSPPLRMLSDAGMWARAMGVAKVGFIPDELSVYRFSADNLTARQGVESRWLDRLWLLESLHAQPSMNGSVPELARVLSQARAYLPVALLKTARWQPRLLPRRLRDTAGYLAYLARRSAGRPSSLNPGLRLTPP